MNENAAIAIQALGAFVAVTGAVIGFSGEPFMGSVFCALGIAAVLSKSGRYRSPR